MGNHTEDGAVRELDLGRVVATKNDLGGIETRVYDARGHRAETGGSAAFPAQSVHDALGRRISLATSRDGSTWDTSSWMRDPATGLCTSKTYADGSSVAYTHTPDGLPLRTTWARGVWRESAYDAARREIGRHYSDPSLDCAFERDVFGALSSASNAVAQTAFLRDNPGMPTNETHAIAGDSFAIRRAYDANGRLASLEWAADGGRGQDSCLPADPAASHAHVWRGSRTPPSSAPKTGPQRPAAQRPTPK